ncbi:cyclophane-forming radical SAM peptide maturase AmcB [Catenulispora rubra]|uniref:cyclophane-forming radical SAM peptide maturase AmcB n=1 Tax=Catenulispora rubra TaxID=280293 RepID=UPI0018925FDE|nr:cyclophane-forming radical SAM peptide maturase AmcB [Catenulispora rubra]
MSIVATAEHATAAYARWIAPQPSLVVMQPDTFCNMDCSAYCYLPLRKRRNRMPVAVARAVAASLAELGPDESGRRQVAEVCWHGGEPLAVGVDALTELLAPFEPLRTAGLIHHSVQTNATLITDSWCDFFQGYDFSIGVSIDGPADLDARRTDRAGRPAHDRIMTGIDRLRRRGIKFSVIAVVGKAGISRAEYLLDFLTELGADQICLNIEEFEGSNTGSQPGSAEARDFWIRTIAWSAAHPGVKIRELDRLGSYLGTIRAGERAAWEAHRFDPLPTIAYNGDVVLLSPELAGIHDELYGDFIAGNIVEQDLASILARAWQLPYIAEFTEGLAACRATCSFFDFCRGAAAGNRYFENGTFTSTETNYCRVSRQELINALIDTTRKEEP